MKRYRLLSAAIGLAAVLLVAGAALARPLSHERIVSGDYALTLGWLDEPPIVGMKNAALVEVATVKDNRPITGTEGTLTAQIVYGGKAKDLVLRPLEDQPGAYVGDFIPTRRGTYTLKVDGTINGQTIDVSNDIEEVVTPDSLSFPEAPADLQASITALQNDLSATRTFAIVGAALGTIGLVLAGVAIGRSRK